MLGKSAKLVGVWLVVTLLLYVVAYFAMPETPPSASLVMLLAGIAGLLVWVLGPDGAPCDRRKTRKQKQWLCSGLPSCSAC